MIQAPEFVKKWAESHGKERAGSHEHFLDLCRLLGEQGPNEADPSGDFYAFEKGAKTPDGDGFADVWLRNHFAWEYKGKRKDLEVAYRQVQTYREALGNPPLLVVCDFDRYEVHTNWTNTETWIYKFTNDQIATDDVVRVTTLADAPAAGAPELPALQVLKAIFEHPDKLKPQRTTDQITRQAAALFGEISDDLRKWGTEDMEIARFITRLMFCMFATDVRLLAPATFSKVIAKGMSDNAAFRKHLSRLFKVMKKGGEFEMERIPHFNGHLFEDDHVPDHVTTQEIKTLEKLDALNWIEVEPSIFGTLFMYVLDPAERRRKGQLYTSRADIELIVEPVLMQPLRKEWESIRSQVEELIGPDKRPSEAKQKKAEGLIKNFQKKLANLRILDPACGSGNFLYVSLALLKALEKEVVAFGTVNGMRMKYKVHPRQLYGIEVNQYAHELASVVIWIGYLQWKHRNVMRLDDEEPILEPLDNIQHTDAVLTDGKGEPGWPKVDVIVDNPPFVGGKKMREALGGKYVDDLFAVWEGRVPREADFCCYWFEKSRAALEAGHATRAGLLATQGIRGGKRRRVLERIKETGDIFYAQADRKWIQDGVAVRVSMVGFDDGSESERLLNEDPDDDPRHALNRARPVPEINANLTSQEDVTAARRLKENSGISFMGDTKIGLFDISETEARRMLSLPTPTESRIAT